MNRIDSSTLTEALSQSAKHGQQLTSFRPPRKNMSAQEIKEFEAAEVEDFSIDSLPLSQRRAAREMAAVANAIVLKGLLNRLDPKTYPVPQLATAPEAKAAALARGLNKRVFAKLRPNLERAVRQPARIQRHLGPLQSLDLRQVNLHPSLGTLERHLNTKPLPETEDVVVRSASTYNRLHVVLRALHCLDETNPEGGADEMVLGGLLIGASGNVKAFPAVLCGDFNEGGHVYQNFGEYFLGQLSLNTTNGYPKSFYTIFKLVESDSDDREVAEELTVTLSFLAQVILSAVVTPLVGQSVGAVITAIGSFIENIIDEDEFPPHGIRLTMTNNNHFGGPVSPMLRTDKITGHGGAYRIGYRYILNA